MKIISWNCKTAYFSKNKVNHILKFNPDIVIIPECENFEEQTTKKLWFGDNKKKGLGIFSYSDYEFNLHEIYNPNFKYIIPIKVTGKLNFILLAVWTKEDKEDYKQRYIGQIYRAINYYKELLDRPIVIIGDFNWNVIWDIKPDYPLYGNLTEIIQILKNKDITSVYHSYNREEFGKESKPTLFFQHNKDKPYHIDYCFASNNFKVRKIEVGEFSEWIKISDHVPLIIEFDNN